WEMGDTGPCGPCSEIHIDLRTKAEREKTHGKDLVNQDHPEVVEIWNLVFIEFNRTTDGKLHALPQKHVDTGMGFERLCMALQDKKSNYDTDVFQPLIQQLEKVSNINYQDNDDVAIAMRVISDHIRAVSFAVADGQLPSNNKAGYVIRRILRRAIRYGFTFLNLKEPFMYKLLPVLVRQMGEPFPELVKQQELISKVIFEEEQAFLKTLETGIQMLDKVIARARKQNQDTIDGKLAFELYDTYGFPLDLTELILKEQQLKIDRKGFDEEMASQKKRSRKASETKTGDWSVLKQAEATDFTGYDELETKVQIVRYRPVEVKGKTLYQAVFDRTPFYAESGGQVGDTGYLEDESGNRTSVIDTKKENNLSVHILDKLPENPEATFKAVVSSRIRTLTANNHTATHLLHHALREVLGEHVEQKGSLVRHDYLRFDFSHFSRMTSEEIKEVEKRVNRKIRQNTPREEKREMSLEKAKAMGAMSLFGEKYEDKVRVIRFGDSVELCGGTHVEATGQIGVFKIRSESAIAAGIRRIEAVTADEAERYVELKLEQLQTITSFYKNTKNVVKSVEQTLDENRKLQKEIEKLNKAQANMAKDELKKDIIRVNGVNFLAKKVNMDMNAVKDLAFGLLKEEDDLMLVLAIASGDKANLTVALSENLFRNKKLHAGNMVKELAKEIGGGGGGQPHFASAGGKNPDGIQAALDKARNMISDLD
ncbi:MAG TPA: alanine--tRNA ligase, partial [Bacteroidales bacterium]|nr:alanine--tRNA ligase [Bacteroidales bacterium]